MVVIFSAVITKERLENVAEAPGIVVPAIRTTEMDAIIAKMISVSVQVLLKMIRK